ncbi:MAG: L,D-transpeptidase [Candidatus Pacebacteria bacterium]|nr:L,D-transpeptidase [Candidatus Paceibacterota bacterium]
MIESYKYSRREILILIRDLGIAAAIIYLIGLPIPTLAEDFTPEDRQAPELPSENTPIYFPSIDSERAGFHLEGPIRDFWRGHSHGLTMGAPITEPMEQADGSIIQYFESAGLKIDPETQAISFLPIGRQYLEATGDAYNEYLISPEEAGEVEMLNRYYVAIHGGATAFGQPLSRPIPIGDNPNDKIQIFENMVLAEYDQIEVPPLMETTYNQYYQPKKQLEWGRGRSPLMWPGETLTLPMGQILQQNGRLPTGQATSIRPDARQYRPDLWGRDQRILVDTKYYGQRLYVVEGDLVVMEVPVSTGKDSTGFFTDQTSVEGTTIVNWREMMDYLSPLEGVDYLAPNVPWNMSLGHKPDLFLHGIYWHPNFGRQASHGCVNMSPMHAELLYRMTSAQTRVIIRPDMDTSFGHVNTDGLRRVSTPPPPFPLEDDYHPYAA